MLIISKIKISTIKTVGAKIVDRANPPLDLIKAIYDNTELKDIPFNYSNTIPDCGFSDY
jgi:hypothetical protein